MQRTLAPFAPLKSLQGELITDIAIGLSDEQTRKLERAGLLSMRGLHEAILVAGSSLEEFLGLSKEELDGIHAHIVEELGDLNIAPEERERLDSLECPTGDLDGEEALDADADCEIELTNDTQLVESFGLKPATDAAVGFMDKMPPIRHQGKRGTCVAFTVTRCYEFMHQDTDLSEHFVYWNTKEIDGRPRPGTLAIHATAAINKFGLAEEVFCAYPPTVDCALHRGEKPSAEAYENAKKHPLKTKGIRLRATDIPSIKIALSNQIPVAMSIPVFDCWFKSKDVRRTGILFNAGERESGGHAVTLVGYFQDPDDDDQSYFIFDNSWGTGWASENHYGSGRGIVPFSYVRDFCTTRFAHILLDSLPVEPAIEAQKEPAKGIG